MVPMVVSTCSVEASCARAPFPLPFWHQATGEPRARQTPGVLARRSLEQLCGSAFPPRFGLEKRPEVGFALAGAGRAGTRANRWPCRVPNRTPFAYSRGCVTFSPFLPLSHLTVVRPPAQAPLRSDPILSATGFALGATTSSIWPGSTFRVPPGLQFRILYATASTPSGRGLYGSLGRQRGLK